MAEKHPDWWPKLDRIEDPIIPAETWQQVGGLKKVTFTIGRPVPYTIPAPVGGKACYYVPVEFQGEVDVVFGEAPSDALLNALRHTHRRVTRWLGPSVEKV